MKKLLIILLGVCFAVPAFAAGVRAIDNDAWLDHLGQMQIIRQQILSLVTKEDATADDKAVLEVLNADFAAQKARWDNYLVEVSQANEALEADEENLEQTGRYGDHKCKGDCEGKRKHKQLWKKSCKDCGENCTGKCKDCKYKKERKRACKKARKEACAKGKAAGKGCCND